MSQTLDSRELDAATNTFEKYSRNSSDWQHLLSLRIRLRAIRRSAWLRKLWSEEGTMRGHMTVTHAEVDSILAGNDNQTAEAEWFASTAELEEWNRELDQIDAKRADSEESRLENLYQIFGIDARGADLFEACFALANDDSMSRAFAYLQDNAGRGYVTESLVQRLFQHPKLGVWNSESPLKIWRIIQEREVAANEPPSLHCDPSIRDWLLNQPSLPSILRGVTSIHETRPPLQHWPIDEIVKQVEHVIENDSPGKIRVLVMGPAGSGRKTLASVVSAKLGLPLLVIDCDQIEEEDWVDTHLYAQRQAFLDRMALAWTGEMITIRKWPNTVPRFPVQFIILDPDQSPPPAEPEFVEYRFDMPELGIDARVELWRTLVPQAAKWSEASLRELSTRFRFTIGDVVDVANKQIDQPDLAAKLIREKTRHRLGKLAQLLECPFTWDDLVINERVRAVLQDLAFEAEHRVLFWEQDGARRLFPQGRGLLSLFIGPPGTGKTMAAQILAASLGKDLFRIDLSAVVSKYVGETSQNIEQILSRARQMDAVLLFDEADSLFGKRTEIKDAHDRFANTDTNYLLQAIEDYRGVAILASNRKENIDSAFMRRIRYALEFSKPDADQRLTIWRRILSELIGPHALTLPDERGRNLDEQLPTFAETLEFTGAQIKTVVLAAIFAAKREAQNVAARHLVVGVDRELMKEGRALSEREQRRLSHHAK